jgi:bifunctional non-homologous end joining protein LigD
MKPAPALREERSALTGRSMPEIAEAADARWQSHHSQDPYAGELSGLPDAELHFIEPMQGKLAAELPEGPRWMYEIKFDGYRALALKTAEGLQLLSRNRRILNRRFPMAAEALEALEDGTMLDGEVVALDDRGRPSFQILQHHQSTARRIYYYAFDLLAWRGKSLLDLPLEKRREMLEGGALAALRDPVRLSAVLEASAADVAAAAREQGLEGLVAKRRNSRYEPGKRSGAWVKYKLNQSQELVIGGYMPGKDRFQSLLAGYYDRRKLIFIAKVKNGFVPAVKEQVYRRFQGLETDVCPFANLPEPRSVRRGEALTAEVMNKCRWLKPEMVAQVEFTEWTQANHLRHSRFVGLRDDKDPREVTRERPD